MALAPPPDTGQVLAGTPSFPPIYKKIAPWKSKTIWATALTAALSFYPPAQDLLARYPCLSLFVVSAVFFILRLVTHGKISLDQ